MFPRYLLDFSTSKLKASYYDVLIVGSGIAGLSVALETGQSANTLLITKGDFTESSSYQAQGGVAVALNPLDSFEKHAADTIEVGDGLSDEEVVKIVAREGIERIKEVIRMGVSFDRSNSDFDYSLEGGHTQPRILHKADQTGKAVIEGLKKEVESLRFLEIREKTMLVDVLTISDRAVGALVLTPNQGLEVVWAKVVVLASGGVGEAYFWTTNPAVATGDGIAAAFRAGAEIADMEFVQFHPTALNQKGHRRLLLTEALRGEGAFLVNQHGERIMSGIHPLKELAPRYVVVRKMMEELKRGNKLFLDCRHLSPQKLETKFSFIWQNLSQLGFNMARDLIPISPAAHFCIGGIKADAWGRTSIKGLYACGEVAATYLHGANRLASNSLLEGLVFGFRVGKTVKKSLEIDNLSFSMKKLELEFEDKLQKVEKLKLSELRSELGKMMMEKAGPVREGSHLKELIEFLTERKEMFRLRLVSRDFFELVNLETIGWLIGQAALRRKESRGVHFREDFFERNDSNFLGHFIWRRSNNGTEVEFRRKNR